MKINGIKLKYGMRVEIDGYDDVKVYDKNNNKIYYEGSKGFWVKREYDENDNEIYYECSGGFWIKREFDENHNRIYYEDSNGVIIDNRPKHTIVIDDKKIELSEESYENLKNSLK